MNKFIKIIGILFLLFATIGCITGEDTGDTADMSDEELESLRVADEQAAPEHAVEKDKVAEDKVQIKPAEYDSTLVKYYEIVESEDDTWKSAIRKQYRVVVPTDISKEELKATLIQIVLDKTSENKDIDAISIFAYDRREDVNGAYTLGTVDWCPNGNWGAVTPEIASSNDRSSYEYVFDIKEKVGDENLERPTDLEFEIRDYYTVCSDAEWDKIDLSDPYAVVDEDVVYQKVADKYGITKGEAEEICMKVTLYQMQ
jgi:hypothetical protein